MAKPQSDISKNVDEIIAGFLAYLKKENQVELLPKIVKKMQEQILLTHIQGEIISYVPLTNDQIRTITEVVQQKFHKQVEFTNKISKSILGGLIIKFNDIIIDKSLKTQLEELKKKAYGY